MASLCNWEQILRFLDAVFLRVFYLFFFFLSFIKTFGSLPYIGNNIDVFFLAALSLNFLHLSSC